MLGNPLAHARGLRDHKSAVPIRFAPMTKLITSAGLGALAVAACNASAFAQAMVPNGGGAIVNIPPPAVDVWARWISVIAIVVAIPSFAWTRSDKWLERSDAKEAKEPAVNAILEETTSHNAWILRLTIKNRGDFTLALDQIRVSEGFKLTTGRGEPPQSTETFEAHAEPGRLISIDASVFVQRKRRLPLPLLL
jgi:hypothetical protein